MTTVAVRRRPALLQDNKKWAPPLSEDFFVLSDHGALGSERVGTLAKPAQSVQHTIGARFGIGRALGPQPNLWGYPREEQPESG